MFITVCDQAEDFSSVSVTIKRREFIFHPVTVLISSIVPSPNSFVNDSRSSLFIGSSGSVGQSRTYIANGTAFAALRAFSPV